MTAYEPRPIRFLDLWHVDDWRIKLYGIAYARAGFSSTPRSPRASSAPMSAMARRR